MCWSPLLVSPAASGNIESNQTHPADGPLRLPLSFERNDGQASAEVRYQARGLGYRLLLLDDGARLAVPGGAIVGLRFSGAEGPERVEGEGLLPGRSHYLRAGKSIIDVPHFDRVRYRQAYPGIDVVFYGAPRQPDAGADGPLPRKGNRVEFDFVVAPGASPGRIAVEYDGARSLRVDTDGHLRLETESGVFWQKRPFAYQLDAGEQRVVECRYVLVDERHVTIEVGGYDSGLPLVIDPVLSFSTYFGGGGDDYVTDIAVGPQGDVYLTGYTRSPNLPLAGALQPYLAGYADAFVVKLAANGNSLIYATYLGGEMSDAARAIAVDAAGSAYITGESNSMYFPTTASSYRNTCCGVFVAKLASSGAGLDYSTFLGSGVARGIAVDTSGAAFVTGWTGGDFPVTAGALQTASAGGEDGFVTRLSPAGDAIVWSTRIGGGGNDRPMDIALDTAGSAYVAGSTESVDFPVTAGAARTAYRAMRDAFLTKVNPGGTGLGYSSYIGGYGNDYATSVAVSAAGEAFVAGTTDSINFPATAGAYKPYPVGQSPWAFVTRMNAGGSAFVYSTLVGEAVDICDAALAVDASGSAFVAGATASARFPATVDAFQRDFGGARDAFLIQLNETGSDVLSATYFGGTLEEYVTGMTRGSDGDLYLTGHSRSSDLPVTPGAYQPAYRGGNDAFVARIRPAQSGKVTGDLDADGFKDILWQQTTDGRVFIWYLQGALGNQLRSSGWLTSSPQIGWRLAAVGDFNRDGSEDMVWQDSGGRVIVWYMGGGLGTTLLATRWINSTGIADWMIVASGDLNGDGTPDLVWQEISNGRVNAWYMGGTFGTQTLGSAWLAGSPMGAWKIAAVADLNNDAHQDLIWRDADGRVAAWYMGGSGSSLYESMSWLSQTPQPDWVPVGAGDLDRDGSVDLVWQDAAGKVVVWYMSGLKSDHYRSMAWIAGSPQTGWRAIFP